MAAEMVSSALAQEAVNHVLERIEEGHLDNSDANENIERMEMAHIKLVAALETSKKWNVTSMPLLRWRSKLKRAAQECDHTLRRCRQRLHEEEDVQQKVRTSSFPMRIAHTALSFVSSVISGGNDEELRGSSVAVRRFEWFADGANEFLRYMELGGTPHRYMFFNPLIRHLLAGEGTKYCFVHRGQHLSFVLQPFSLPEHGMEVNLVFSLEDANAPENNFVLALDLRLSESTDIIGDAVRCLQLFTPHLSSVVETVKTKLTQVPTHDLCWVSDAYSIFGVCVEHQNNLHTIYSRWLRPNPTCCLHEDHHYTQSYNSISSSSEPVPCHIYLEPLIHMYLLGHVKLSVGNNWQRSMVYSENKTTSPMSDFPYLKLGAHFFPHASFEDLLPAAEGSVTETINGVAVPHDLSAKSNVSIEQLGDIMIPKAVDCLHGSVAATSYEILWKSKHGGAYLQADKISWGLTNRKGIDGKPPKRQQGKKVQGLTSANKDFLSSWIVHAPAHLQGSVVDWDQKEKQLSLPLLLKTNPCIDECPVMLVSWQYNRYLAKKIKSFGKFSA